MAKSDGHDQVRKERGQEGPSIVQSNVVTSQDSLIIGEPSAEAFNVEGQHDDETFRSVETAEAAEHDAQEHATADRNVGSLADTAKRWKCVTCEKEFKTWQDLSAHRTYFMGYCLKPPHQLFVCCWCGKVCARRQGLQIHNRSHFVFVQNDMPWWAWACPEEGCTMCLPGGDQPYATRDQVEAHMLRTHESVQPWDCQALLILGKDFPCLFKGCREPQHTLEKLKRHMKSHVKRIP